MVRVNVHDAKTNLSKYLALVEQGEQVVICRRNEPIIQLTKIEQPTEQKRRIIGWAKKQYGDYKLPDSFFEPLPNDLIEAFEGK